MIHRHVFLIEWHTWLLQRSPRKNYNSKRRWWWRMFAHGRKSFENHPHFFFFSCLSHLFFNLSILELVFQYFFPPLLWYLYFELDKHSIFSNTCTKIANFWVLFSVIIWLYICWSESWGYVLPMFQRKNAGKDFLNSRSLIGRFHIFTSDVILFFDGGKI